MGDPAAWVREAFDDDWDWREAPIPGQPGETEWRHVRVIKNLRIISAGPVSDPPWPRS